MADAGTVELAVVPELASFGPLLQTGILKQLGPIEAKLKSAFSGIIAGLGGGMNAAFIGIGAVAAAGILKGIHATQEWASDVKTLQRVTGQTAEDASKLAAAGTAVGVSVQQMSMGFGLLAKNIINGSANMEKYGLATEDAQGNMLPFNDILANISDKFQSLPAGPEQAAFAMNVFGRSGKSLIPVLRQGSEGLSELYDQAVKAGLVMSGEDLEASKQLGIAQRELGHAFEGFSIALGRDFVPVMTQVLNVVKQVVELFQLIPDPIRKTALQFAVFAGALIAVQKLAHGVTGAIERMVVAHQEAAVAEENEAAAAGATADVTATLAETEGATVGPTTELVAALTRLTETLGSSAETGAVATDSLVGFEVAESGLIVPTNTATTAITEQTAAVVADEEALTAGGAAAVGFGAKLSAVGASAGAFVRFLAPLAAGFAAFSIGSGILSDMHRDFDQLSEDTHVNAGLLADFQERLKHVQPGAGVVDNWKKFFGTLDGVGDQLQTITDDAQPLIERMDALGLSNDQLNVVLDKYINQIDGSAEGTDAYIESTGNLVSSLETAKKSFEDGSISTSQYRASLIGAGLSSQDATGLINASLDTMGQHLDQAGRAVNNFAKMTGKEFKDWKSGLIDTINSTFGQLGVSVKDTFDITQRELHRDFTQMLQASRRFNQDLGKLFKLKKGTFGLDKADLQSFQVWMTQQAPGYVDAFVSASTANQKEFVRDWEGNQKNIREATKEIPPLKITADFTQMDMVKNQLDAIAAEIGNINSTPIKPGSGTHVPTSTTTDKGHTGSGKVLEAQGAINIPHLATGGITQAPVFQFGEGGYPTFAGKGAEEVIPLNERGIAIHARALELAMMHMARGGSQEKRPDREYKLTIDNWDKGEGRIRTIAKDEVERENEWRERFR